MARVLITNGGSHTADNWAIATAEMIVQIDPGMVGDRLLAAEKLKLTIAEALSPHHAKVQADERSKLDANSAYIMEPHEVEEYLDGVVKDVVNATKGSPWGAHYTDPTVQLAMRDILASHLRTSQHVERLWFADNHPEHEAVQSYKQIFPKE